jgi:hypothetical protein
VVDLLLNFLVAIRHPLLREALTHVIDLFLCLLMCLVRGSFRSESKTENRPQGHSEDRSSRERTDHGRVDRSRHLSHFLEICCNFLH